MILSRVPGGKSLAETRVLLLRHAETSAPDRFHGSESDIDLGERGRNQAEAVARYLSEFRPAALFCSAMKRARETAEPIARSCGLVIQVEPTLHERSMGPLSGLSREEGSAAYNEAKRRWTSGEVDYTHEGGESYAEIRDRVVPVLHRLVDAWPGETIMVVAHGVVIRVLLTTLLEGRGPGDFDRYAIDNVAINDLRWDGIRWSAVTLNQRVTKNLDGFAW